MGAAIAALFFWAPAVAQGMTEVGAVEPPVPVRVFPIAGPHDLQIDRRRRPSPFVARDPGFVLSGAARWRRGRELRPNVLGAESGARVPDRAGSLAPHAAVTARGHV
jgi:hypothetical protein